MNAQTIIMSAGTLVLVASSAVALDVPEDAPADVQTREVIVVETKNDDADAHAVEVKVDNGQVSVRLDGQPVDPDRIREEGGRIEIVDEQGNVIESLRRLNIGGTHDFTVRIGEKGEEGSDFVFSPFGGEFRFGPAADAGPTPPVMLGLTMAEPGPALRKHLRLEAGTSSMITSVLEGFPAYQAGLETYDVIVEIEGAEKADPRSIREALMDRAPGDRVHLTVIHEGHREKTSVIVTAYDAEAMRDANALGNVPFILPRLQEGEAPAPPDVFVVPDGQRPKVFWRQEINPDEIREQVEKQLRRFREQAGDEEGQVDGRLEEMSDRMVDIERLLDRLLDQLEEQRKKDD